MPGNRLLYVGITYDLQGRFTAHRYDEPWWSEVDSFTVEWFPRRGRAKAAETYAIRKEQPKYNIVGLDLPLKWLRRNYDSLAQACPRDHRFYARIQRLGPRVYRSGLHPEDIRHLRAILAAYWDVIREEQEAAEREYYRQRYGGD